VTDDVLLSSPARPPAAAHRPQLSGAAARPPERTLVEVLLATAEEHPDAPALDDGERSLSYTDLLAEVRAVGRRLTRAGLGAGDRIGVRVPSGTAELYVGILAVLLVGAAYVPVDADDPEERARLVFGEAGVAGTVGAGGSITVAPGRTGTGPYPAPRMPAPDDDAWIIFTSGSTGRPKGVAVSHRSAAAFVDAEARLFLREDPIGPQDRVLAGLSVAFDASCEEMWLAWRHGACLVPAPRSLVRSGTDLGPWLETRGITVVSTVPTLAAMWPATALDSVRLLIFGGEACPPELADRLADGSRELWNTYGPTEATVVACAAQLHAGAPVTIGLPLDGWDLAVVDADGVPVPEGGTGELIIGGVGLARYLDPAKDAGKYAPMPGLGWDRAYRSGDLVTYDPAGLLFVGRADDQVKLGGRRIELGEVDAALQALPGVRGAAAAVQETAAGHQVLVGYLVPEDARGASAPFDTAAAREHLAQALPAALIPLLAVTDDLPTKTSGKVDRGALPWPLPGAADAAAADLTGTDEEDRWILEQWAAVLGVGPVGPDADFFAHGGGSLAAAQLVSALRQKYPTVTVSDVYAHPRAGALVEMVRRDAPKPRAAAHATDERSVRRTARRSQVFQTLMGVPLQVLAGMRWLTWLLVLNNVLGSTGLLPGAPVVSWWWVLAAWLVFLSPLGRMGLTVLAARILLRGLTPGDYPRSGRVHLRLWLVEGIAQASRAVSLSSAPWMPYYARALGARIGRDVDLHSVPPVTGLLTVGRGAAVEPEVDLSGWWIDGDVLHVGSVQIGADAVVGARSTLMPGTRIGRGARVGAGSAVLGRVKDGVRAEGSPAQAAGRHRPGWPAGPAPRSRWWATAYGLASVVLSAIPYLAAAAAAAVLGAALRPELGQAPTLTALLADRTLLWAVPLAALVWFLVCALLVLAVVRALSRGITAGHHPVRSAVGWRIWATERVMDMARELLFPLYAGLSTPVWMRLLGARVGRDAEISTAVLIPCLTTIGAGAFLADDTKLAPYELGGGWMHVGPVKIGKRSFLGNSGLAAAGRRVRKNSLVAVLSSAPEKAKAGSSWLGSPPIRLRRTAVEADDALTYAPPARLKVLRGAVESLRLTAVVASTALVFLTVLVLDRIVQGSGYAVAGLVSGAVMMGAGLLAAVLSVLVKWALVGRIRGGEHPLWSSFVWRNELQDTFVELVAAPWFANAAAGTPALVWYLRALGARIGHGVWCETYWLPEADLVRLGHASTVNRGTVLQTHLFHDRIMSLDTVALGTGATMGPHGVILPAASVGDATTVGPVSLVMRGESVPAASYWTGNPVRPWSRNVPVPTAGAATGP
jgi:non-ribosomal peptide synthetase-like protein